MSSLIKKFEDILANITDNIVKFMKKIFISDEKRLLSFVISIVLLLMMAYLLKFPVALLQLLGTNVFALISSNVVFKIFNIIWLVLTWLGYCLALFYLICLVAKRYFDKPKEKKVNNILVRIYDSYPMLLKTILYLFYAWLIIMALILMVALIFMILLAISGVRLLGIAFVIAGIFLILLYIIDTLYLSIKKVGAKNEK